MDELRNVNGKEAQELQMAPCAEASVAPGDRPAEGTLYTIDEAITDAIEQISGEPFPDPFTGEHAIEYWIWSGSRLVAASPDTAERLRQQEALLKAEALLARERLRTRTLGQRLRRWLGWLKPRAISNER